MIQITKIKNGCNCYIIENDGEGVLIDTGLSKGKNKIVDACQEKNIKLIILTHGHMDHIQCANYISKALAAPILMHEKDLELISNNLCQDMKGRMIMGKILSFFSKLGAKYTTIERFEPQNIINSDTTIHECGIDIEIMELPGHTRGSIGIKIEEHFFVGDALMHMIRPGISLLYENWDDLFESAKKITNVACTTIHFGHGNEVKNPPFFQVLTLLLTANNY